MDLSDRRIDENRLSARLSAEKEEFFLRAEYYLQNNQFQEAVVPGGRNGPPAPRRP